MGFKVFTAILILAAIVAFAVGGFLIGEKPRIYGILCFLFVGFVIFGVYKACTTLPTYTHTCTEYLAALQDNNLVSSRCYMRRGRINEELWYQYMYKFGSGYKTNKCKAKTSVIYCDDEETPRVEWYDVEKKWFCFSLKEEKYKKIYIPEGSIVEDYTIDLE